MRTRASSSTNKNANKNNTVAIIVAVAIFAGLFGSLGGIFSWEKFIGPTIIKEEQVDDVRTEVASITYQYINEYFGSTNDAGIKQLIVSDVNADEIAKSAAQLVSADLINSAMQGVATKEDLNTLEAKITNMLGTYQFSDAQVRDLSLAVSALIEADLDALNKETTEQTVLTQSILEKISELENRLKIAEDNIEQLQQSVAKLQEDILALQTQSSSDYATTTSVQELTEKYNDIIRKYSEQTGVVEGLVVDSATNTTALETLSKNLTTVQSNLTTMQQGIEQQIKALQTAVTTVQSDTSVKDQITALQKESDNKKSQISALTDTIATLNTQIQSLTTAASDTQSQITTLNDKATKLSADINTLSGNTSDNIKNLQFQADEANQKISNLKQQIADTNATIVVLETKISNAQSDFNSKLDTATANNTGLSSEQTLLLEKQITAANTEIAALQEQLEATKQEYETKIAQANNANTETNNKILELENEIANTNADTTELQKELNQAINDYNSQVEDAETLTDVLKSKLAELETALSTANANMASLQSELDATKQEYNEQFGTTHVSAESLQSDIQALNEQLNTARSNLAVLESDLAGVRQEYNGKIAALEAAEAVTKSRVTILETDMARNGADIENLQTELNATNNQLATLRSDLTDTNNKINELETTLTNTEASLTNTQNEFAVAQRTISSLETATSNNTTDIANLQGDMETLNATLEAINNQKADLKALQDLITKMVAGLGGESTGNMMDTIDPETGLVSSYGDITIVSNALTGLKNTCADLSSRVALLEQRTDALEEKTKNIASGAGIGSGTNIGAEVAIGDNVTVPFSLKKQGDIYGYVTEDGTFVDFKSQYDITSAVTDAMVGDATEDKVLEGYTFTNETQTGLTGTIPLKAAEIYTPGQSSILLEAGQYLDGDQVIRGDANLSPENIRYGVSMFDIDGTFTADGTIRPSHILAGKVGYSQGNQVVGTIQTLSSSQFEGTRNAQNNYEVRPKFNGYVPAQTLVNTLAATTIQAGAQSDGTFKYSIAADKYTGAGSSGSIAKLTPAYSVNSGQNGVLAGGTITLAGNTYIKDTIVIKATSLAEQTKPASGKTAYQAGHLLEGYSGWINGGQINGTMPNRGAWGDTLNTGKTSVTIPAGYHNGSGKVSITIQAKSATPTGSAQTIYPDNGQLLSSVSISAVTSSSGIGKTLYDSGRSQGQSDVISNPVGYLGGGTYNKLTANSGTGNQTYDITDGYWQTMIVDQTAPYNAGYNAGYSAGRSPERGSSTQVACDKAWTYNNKVYFGIDYGYYPNSSYGGMNGVSEKYITYEALARDLGLNSAIWLESNQILGISGTMANLHARTPDTKLNNAHNDSRALYNVSLHQIDGHYCDDARVWFGTNVDGVERLCVGIPHTGYWTQVEALGVPTDDVLKCMNVYRDVNFKIYLAGNGYEKVVDYTGWYLIACENQCNIEVSNGLISWGQENYANDGSYYDDDFNGFKLKMVQLQKGATLKVSGGLVYVYLIAS